MSPVKVWLLEFIKTRLKTERVVHDAIWVYFLKIIYSFFLLKQPTHKTVIWIIGCQRSGTSLMNRVFTRDFRIWVYRECSVLSLGKGQDRLRLRSYKEVKREIDKNKFSYIVAKPLVETQNILDMLEHFPNSKAIWMYRDYKDFVRSNIARFDGSGGIYGMRAIVQRDPTNWRSQRLSDYVHSIAAKYYSDEMSIYDASALFWFVRNQLFFELKLDTNPCIFICRYKDLVEQPQIMMQSLYEFVGIDNFDKKKASSEISSQSVGRGKNIILSPEIENLCESLINRMNKVYFSKYPVFDDNRKVTLV